MSKIYYALCVDDEQTVLNQLDMQLQEHFRDFCEFEYVQSGEEALDIYHDLVAQGERIWLVISDQVMPGMSGDELLAQIHQENPQIIKVLLTGQGGLESTIRAINHAGLNYYIEKPWSKDDLLLALDKLKFHYEMTTILNEMNLRFASSLDLEKTLNTVFYNILNIIQAEAGSIFLIEEHLDVLVCKICQGPKDITGTRVPLGTGILGHVAETRRIDVTSDVKQDKRHYGQIDEQSGFTTKTMVSVPLISKDEVLGVIQVINKKGGKLFSQEDINLLQALSSGGALAIQNAQYAQRLLQEERTQSELRFARQIQQDILPNPFEGHPAIHFEAINKSAEVVGGDFYDYFQVSDHEFAFVIGDVCGKSLPAAFFMASSRSILKAQALANSHPLNVIPPANTLIAEDAKHHGLYVTVFYGVYKIDTHILHYVNGGHPPALLFRPSTISCSSLITRDLPIGMFGHTTFEDAQILLEQGDVLVLYTDGITEAENAARKPFGVDRLVDIVLEYGKSSPKELQEAIVNSVRTFSKSQKQRDDMTVMIVQV